MKSIAEVQQDKEPNFMRKILTYDWIFSTALEKISIIIIVALAFYGLLRLIF